MAAAEHGALPVADDYALAESDRAVLAAQARSPGHLFRTKAAYTGGIDGCVDDVIAFTRPWNFDIGSIQAPVSLSGTGQMMPCALGLTLTGSAST